MENEFIKTTPLGSIRGIKENGVETFLGIPFAKAERFAYAAPADAWEGTLDATDFGPACPQYRAWFPHLDNPERLFYFREFREGLEFTYDENCLNLNIYAPEQAENCPVLLFYYGGGFNSGSNAEEPFRGDGLARRGIVSVFANYRVGLLGYLAHEEIQKEFGRDGNFGLDDQLTALRWVKKHIAAFGGDPDNVTLMGQSAGAISIQYLCLNEANRGLFKRAVMMSGAGLFPRFALPKPVAETHAYWEAFQEAAGCRSLKELREMDLAALFAAHENFKQGRKDNIYNTMPVVDGVLIPDAIDKLIDRPLPIDYLIGFTSGDMYAPVMAHIGLRFGRANGAYLYYFDREAPGDKNGAFHSSDLRYVFERLETSWRPYGDRDREISRQMADAIAAFAKTGDPNTDSLPAWTPADAGHKKVMCFREKTTAMGRPDFLKMTAHMLTKGDPKA